MLLEYDRLFIDGINYRPKQRAGGLLSPYEFPELIGEALEKAWFGVNYKFTPEYPKETNVITPTITWSIYHRIPSRGADRRQPKPQPMEVLKNGNESLEIWVQPWTVIYQFDCYAETAEEANNLCERYEQFITEMKPLFMERGVVQLIFEEQLDDKLANRNQERLRVRSLRYKAILESHVVRRVGIMERVELALLDKIRAYRNEQHVRSSDECDTLASKRVYIILSLTNEDQTVEYIQGVDYNLVEKEGYSYIRWVEGALNPAVGETYLVTYFRYS